MTCNCKCCCGCCCDGEEGSQTLEAPCTAPKEFKGKGTICDVCCDLGEIREDIESEEDCPGTWVTNGRCMETPCEPPCSGSCDAENPCPEGCHCCGGECQDEPCEECEANIDCCVWEGHYVMECSAAALCTDAGGIFVCEDDPFGICYFQEDPIGSAIPGPCDALAPPLGVSNSQTGYLGPYEGPYSLLGVPCGFFGLPPSNCVRAGRCCDNECRVEDCNPLP
jgi:hypothetical protein